MPVVPANSFWTADRWARLKQLAPLYTARQIAEMLGTTRNAVIGKATRHGLRIRHYTEAASARARIEAHRMRQRERRASLPPLPRRPRQPPPPPPPAHGLPLVGLDEQRCHWPLPGDGPPYWFCGHATEEGASYCPYHRRLSVNPSQDRRPACLWMF